jgi:hypothetical protein
MTDQSPKPPRVGRVPIHLPPDLQPIYSNFALITNSRSEIVIDFAQVMPQKQHAQVQSRVVMTSFNAKLLLRALTEHMARFEAQHGEIDLPEGSSLADQLFKPPTNEDE